MSLHYGKSGSASGRTINCGSGSGVTYGSRTRSGYIVVAVVSFPVLEVAILHNVIGDVVLLLILEMVTLLTMGVVAVVSLLVLTFLTMGVVAMA